MENKKNHNGVYSYIEIANYFISAHKTKNTFLTNMQLQKLLYFANGIYLSQKNVPLIREQFRAWKYGPVITELYDDLKRFGSRTISETIQNQNRENLSSDVLELLKSVDNVFGVMDAWVLSDISHIKEGAWDKAPKLNDPLDNDHIIEEFNTYHIPSLKGY